MTNQDLISDIYNAFNPFEPLKPGDSAYVNCSAVRGNENIFNEIGKKIVRSRREAKTCQLYTGHRGVGKSTELLRLKKYLEDNSCFVVYFGATEGDIDELDAQYTDIILACTRHILQALEKCANPSVLLQWLKLRWTALKDLAISEVEIDQLNVEQQIGLFTKLTGSVRRIPSKRETIRKQIDLYSDSLIDSLNEFIKEASKNLPENKTKLVVIADNLDRIVPIERNNNRNNHDEIFIDYSNQLTRLNCHVIYTVPLSLVYSNRAPALRDIYGSPQILPMIMIKTKEGEDYEPGLNILKEIIKCRLKSYYEKLVETQKELQKKSDTLGIFDKKTTLNKLCSMTGGHVRELMLLMQSSIDWIADLPITESAVNRAINDARESTYALAIDNQEWQKLAAVSLSGNIQNEQDYRSLLFRRCVLEYRDEQGKKWYNVHPIIEEIEEFKIPFIKLGIERQVNQISTLDETILESLKDIQEKHDKFVNNNNYEQAYKMAEMAYNMLENLQKKLDIKKDRETYRKIVALSSFWKLRKDLYFVRSKL
ncbi:MAG TPA: pilus assembly protein PilB [Cyanothece sp. UBA12306]|nr:pilus assembly protein PilB [Cyanothece sp. UBA12306]